MCTRRWHAVEIALWRLCGRAYPRRRPPDHAPAAYHPPLRGSAPQCTYVIVQPCMVLNVLSAAARIELVLLPVPWPGEDRPAASRAAAYHTSHTTRKGTVEAGVRSVHHAPCIRAPTDAYERFESRDCVLHGAAAVWVGAEEVVTAGRCSRRRRTHRADDS